MLLQYLRNERYRFKVYVAVRVTEISEMTTASRWYHIGNELNGSKIEDLDENNEIKTKCFANKICKVEPFTEFGVYSSWKRLCHILSYVKRFIKKTEERKVISY